MPNTPKNNTKKNTRTKNILVTSGSDEKIAELTTPEPKPPESASTQTSTPTSSSTNAAGSFQLHVDAAKAPNEVFQPKNPSAVWPDRKITLRDIQKNQSLPRPRSSRALHLTNSLWGNAQWLVTSALIFVVAFFAINYQAYSTLFLDKLDHWREVMNPTASTQEITGQNNSASEGQTPLPLTVTPEQSKKQIPLLQLAVTPPDDRIIVPRIKKNVPIVKVSSENLIKRDWNGLEADIQSALQDGVVHYPGTAEPGENGNAVITGHSSYYFSDPGKFKDVFALLHQVAIGDTIIVYHNQKKYTYQVYETEVVTPDKVEVLTQAGGNRLTLITCTPVGTNLRRLIVLAKPLKTE